MRFWEARRGLSNLACNLSMELAPLLQIYRRHPVQLRRFLDAFILLGALPAIQLVAWCILQIRSLLTSPFLLLFLLVKPGASEILSLSWPFATLVARPAHQTLLLLVSPALQDFTSLALSVSPPVLSTLFLTQESALLAVLSTISSIRSTIIANLVQVDAQPVLPQTNVSAGQAETLLTHFSILSQSG